MSVIYPKRFGQTDEYRSRTTVLWRVCWTAAGIFVLVNAVVFVWYRQHSFPNTRVGKLALGQVSFSELPHRIDSLQLLPSQFAVKIGDSASKLTPDILGAQVDTDRIAERIRAERSWLPVLNFFSAHQIPSYVTIDDNKLAAKATELEVNNQKAPTDAHLTLTHGIFAIIPEQSGYRLDNKRVSGAFTRGLEKGETAITLPVQTIQPTRTKASLTPTLRELQAQQQTAITYTNQDKKRQLTAAETGTWFEPQDDTYTLSDLKIRDSMVVMAASLGTGIKNIDQAADATKQAIQSKEVLHYTFEPLPLKTKSLTYCVAGRGVPQSYVDELIIKLAAVYADPRGWSFGGLVKLNRADSGCDYTVWLVAPDQMPSFGAICDPTWSCNVGTNVVINFDRWEHATDVWNKTGRNLDDYRSLAINHETGHQLGFGHLHCSAPGNPAPVMQQQSVDLEGCDFNAWPLPSERLSLKTMLDL